ncbi:STAS domain-containing protein [Streptomyces sp. NPDC002990]
MTASFHTVIQCAGNTVLISAAGELDAAAGPVLGQVLDVVPPEAAVALIDVHEVPFMDSSGLLLFLELHRRAEHRGFRVLVVGWQPQPRRLMGSIAGLPGAGPYSAKHSALVGFRRMIQERAERERHRAAGEAAEGESLPLG